MKYRVLPVLLPALGLALSSCIYAGGPGYNDGYGGYYGASTNNRLDPDTDISRGRVGGGDHDGGHWH
ncbi:MAG TPA: hypothetical protein VNF99_11180 [Stellaceae bacterium]|nr:hypothetical protein [Stellaceae bacterium]